MDRLLSPQRQCLTMLPTPSAGALVTRVTRFLVMENKLGVKAAPELSRGGCCSPSLHSRHEGQGRAMAKSPRRLFAESTFVPGTQSRCR